MKNSYHSHQESVQHRLIYAQQKLTNSDIPFQLRAVSYIRLTCSAIHQSQPQGSLTDSLSATQISYLKLLSQLINENPNWWTTCYVNLDGLLASNQPNIQQLLKPLNAFVSAYQHPLAA